MRFKRKWVFCWGMGLALVSPLALAADVPESLAGDTPEEIEEKRPDYPTQLGFEFRLSFSALGTQQLVPDQLGSNLDAFSLSFEWQPPWIQRFGVLGFGPSISLYPIFATGVQPTFFSNFGLGGVARYQFHYFQRQLLVPVIGYSAEAFHYSFSTGLAGSFMIKGPLYGVWLLLNMFEPTAANEAFVSTGISRTYAIFEAQNFVGNDDVISVSGFSYYFGVRFEL